MFSLIRSPMDQLNEMQTEISVFDFEVKEISHVTFDEVAIS